MNKVIRFTKIRFLMFTVSLAVIVVGFVGTILHGGFNLGIDFVGGYSQQIQLAPVALDVTYSGTGRVNAVIQRGILNLDILETGRSEQYSFDFRDLQNVDALSTKINSIEGLTANGNLSYTNADTSRLLDTNYEIVLYSGDQFNINIGLASENEIFAYKKDVTDALQDFGRVAVQSLGSEIEQKFSIKIHNEDARLLLLSEEGPSVSGETENAESEEAGTTTDELTDEERLSQTEQNRIQEKVSELLADRFEKDAIILQKNDYIGSTFSKDIAEGAVWSLILALLLILVYISIRFQFNFAVAALSALVHDVAIMIGIIGLLQLEVTTTTFAAILTIVGYSLNDTIVVFDRVRENFGLIRDSSREMVIDTSITQSLSRTLITSLTTLLAVLSIFIFGTGVIKDFAFNLIIGIVVGTYSSIFIASPIVLSWMNAQDKRKKEKKEQKYGKVSPPKQAQPVDNAAADAESEDDAAAGTDRNPGQRIQRRKKKKRKK